MEEVVLVNENDEVVGRKERAKLAPEDIYRVSVLWVTNTKGDVLLAKRSKFKKYPGAWSSAVAGTVEAGESYDDNILKETAEEIGLAVELQDLRRGPKFRFKNDKSNNFSQWYFYTTDKAADSFIVQESEVERLEWFEVDTLKTMLQQSPEAFSPSTVYALTSFFNNQDK